MSGFSAFGTQGVERSRGAGPIPPGEPRVRIASMETPLSPLDMEGYYKDPEATMRAMGDGWFHTGDAAVLHPDVYAEIRGRLKDVIISGGENISSVEVEGV